MPRGFGERSDQTSKKITAAEMASETLLIRHSKRHSTLHSDGSICSITLSPRHPVRMMIGE